jgi:mannose-1-phosphate guanylyltransferase
MSKSQDNYAIIMAGGIGSRFWPMSTTECPKQFLDVLGIGKSLIRLTYERLLHLIDSENIYVVTNEKYVALVKTQIPELTGEQILTEPVRKNTAPCITYAAAKIYAKNENANLVVAPSDHLILKEDRFNKILSIALDESSKGEQLITLGIKPNRPDTGYGYIQFYQDGDIIGGQIKKVKQFTEKPNKELAELFVKSGDYYWNSGIFIWKASTLLKAIQKFKPELYNEFCSNYSIYNTPAEQKFVHDAFISCEDISIDFAIMENAKNIYVVLADFNWSDLGTWSSLYEHLEKDYKGNAADQNVWMVDSTNCIVKLNSEKKAIIQGLKNYIVIESEDKLLILNKEDEQNLKKYLNSLENNQ